MRPHDERPGDDQDCPKNRAIAPGLRLRYPRLSAKWCDRRPARPRVRLRNPWRQARLQRVSKPSGYRRVVLSFCPSTSKTGISLLTGDIVCGGRSPANETTRQGTVMVEVKRAARYLTATVFGSLLPELSSPLSSGLNIPRLN